MAFIDFDLASPGTALWDVAATARLWAPLRCDADISDSRRGQCLSRFRVVADAYGVEDLDREQLVHAVRMNHDWLYTIIRSGADRGNPGFQNYWLQSIKRVERTHRWLKVNHQVLLDSLTMPAQGSL